MKKQQLFQWDQEIQRWFQQGSVLVIFNRSRISDFYKEHQIRIDSLFKEINEIRKQHFVFESEDKVKTIINEATKQPEPVYLEGKTKEDFNQCWDDLMNQEVAERLKLIKP